VAGRTRPMGWAGRPSPWPQGPCRSTTWRLLRRLPTAFPPGSRWRLVAARGFPSAWLVAQLRHAGTGFSVRLRWRAGVMGAGVYAMVVEHVAAGRRVVGLRPAAVRGRGRPEQPLVPGWGVVSAAVAAPPRHQHHPGPARERAKRAWAGAEGDRAAPWQAGWGALDRQGRPEATTALVGSDGAHGVARALEPPLSGVAHHRCLVQQRNQLADHRGGGARPGEPRGDEAPGPRQAQRPRPPARVAAASWG
jgi:hypothetical protein